MPPVREVICRERAGFEEALEGATISESHVCRDGNVITAKGAGVAIEFGLKIAAARNDYESVQLVLKPASDQVLKGVTVSELKGPNGAKIPAENITVRDEFFHFVDHPTDWTGVREFYPDALPPLVFPKTLGAKLNAPLWLPVYVPFGTPAGDYAATVTRRP